MEEMILSILKQVLGKKDIDWSCSQSNCEEWDSMNQLNLVVELESEFGISFEPDEMAELVDCESIKKMIIQKKG